MKNLCITMAVSALLLSPEIWAQDIELQSRRNNPPNPTEFQIPIPVRADLNNSLLGIHFVKKVKQVFVTVSGPNGLIYQREVTTENAKSIYVDLAQYQEGEYNIYFQDAEGNEVSGDFLKDTEE